MDYHKCEHCGEVYAVSDWLFATPDYRFRKPLEKTTGCK